MNALVLSFLAVIALAHGSLHGGIVTAGAIQGPGGHTAVVGPDGSHISAAVAGGAVGVGGGHGGAVVAGVVPGHVGVGVGGLGLGLGGVGLGGVGLGGVGVVGLGHGLVGSGLEGQYVPSGLERLYDDGSYRLEHHLEGAHGVLLHH